MKASHYVVRRMPSGRCLIVAVAFSAEQARRLYIARSAQVPGAVFFVQEVQQ